MKFVFLALVLTTFSNFITAEAAQQTASCGSYRWMVGIQAPASGQDIAKFFQILATDPFQPVLKIQRLTASSDQEEPYVINTVVEFEFQNVGLYTIEEAKVLATTAISQIQKLPNTKVYCDGVSGGGGHLSGSN